jgi:hypothetical protein
MRIRNVLVAALALMVIVAAGTAANARPVKQSCVQHADCGGQGAYCQGGMCAELSPQESYLTVGLEVATASPAFLYVDGALLGQLPWEGIVSVGVHAIRVECQGMTPVAFQGTSAPGAVDYIPIRMEPMSYPGYSGSFGAAPADTGGRGVPGTLRLGLNIGIGYGTAMGAENWSRPVTTLLGGGSFGLRVLAKPVWFELGVMAQSTTLRIKNYPVDKDNDGHIERGMEWGDFLILDLGLQFRLLFPVKKNLFYLGAELDPGAGISNHNYMYADLFFTMSIFPHELFEIFINPIGIDYLQELASSNASFIVSYRATLGVALRFPKKPLF